MAIDKVDVKYYPFYNSNSSSKRPTTTIPFLHPSEEDIKFIAYGTRKKLGENNTVNNPYHYNRKGIECIDAIEASMEPEEFKGYLKGCHFKYVWRYTYKGKPLEDLEKAQWYLEKLIKIIRKEDKKNEA